MAEVRQLAEHCEDSRTQHCLLAEPGVAFDKAFEVHVAMESESAETNVKDLQARSQLPSNPLVNKLNTRATQTHAVGVEINTRQLIVTSRLQNATNVERKDTFSRRVKVCRHTHNRRMAPQLVPLT